MRKIRTFRNEDSAFRLLGAVLMEIDESWRIGYQYLDMLEFWRGLVHYD